jgi:uncharacterized protein YndB with AHSA1/START domain
MGQYERKQAACVELTTMFMNATEGQKKHMTIEDLVFTRMFSAPVERVWQAWTEPELVKQWWGPDGFSCPLANIDFRKGGTSLLAMQAPEEMNMPDSYSTWKYTTILPNERIEYIHNLSDDKGKPIDPTAIGMPADFPQEQRHVLELKDLGDGRTQLTFTEYHWPEGQMREFSRMGMEQCLDKMQKLLEQGEQHDS